ncbi:MAG: Unknown protein [uncultured Sulfurovum sp.]|uniref:Conjugal transfer protein TraM n=1 Tax=uncultured Sulfurovum sp. TaxID=269237 RepID=A0A6S6TK53_9BACT|nr:MAG: Unknown protein [uncultured Sulfurovum sp.]
MKAEEKEKILEAIRKRHGIAIDITDPLFAMVTANEIILEKQFEQQNRIFAEQLIEMEIITKNYLTESKELLEKKLTLAIKEAKTQLKQNKQQNKEETKGNRANNIIRPILFIITGIIIGYTTALIIL